MTFGSLAPGHINYNEGRTYKSLFKYLARSEPDSRPVTLLDSRCTIGANAKGRSSASAINGIQQGAPPFCDWWRTVPSSVASAALQGHNYDWVDLVREADLLQRPFNLWARLLLAFCGDIHPHPGPVRARGRGRAARQVCADFLDQDQTSPEYQQRLRECLAAFVVWLTETHDSALTSLLSQVCCLM